MVCVSWEGGDAKAYVSFNATENSIPGGHPHAPKLHLPPLTLEN